MTIKINNQELEFKFNFKQIKQLIQVTCKDLADLEAVAKDFNNVGLIGSIGTGKSVEEIEELLEADGTFEAVKSILDAFSSEVVKYFNPNLQSQTN